MNAIDKKKTGRRRVALLAVMVALVVAAAAAAAAGELDPSFGGDGIVTTTIGPGDDFAEALDVLPNGSVVVAGASSDDFAVARYEQDGDLDTSFGGDGVVTTQVSPGLDESRSVVAVAGGRALAAGRAFTGSSQDFALVRYTHDGDLDPGFGGDGIVTTAVSAGTDEILALARAAGGKVIAAGRSFDGSGFDFALARYLPNGSLDPSFGGDGVVTTTFGATDDRAFGVTVLPNGKIVAAGHTCTASGCDFALARYLPDGSLDPGFGGDGKVVTAPGPGSGGAFAVDRGSRGRIVAAGLRCDGGDCDFALTRYGTDGSLDPSFDSDGIVRTSFGPGVDEAFGVAVLPGGKIVASGRSSNGSDYDVALARYAKDGSLDAAFGAGGTVTTAVGPGDDQASGLELRGNGDVVVAGSTFNGSDLDIAVARYDG
jgi:uncharacterized delta-60 repeat protein